MRNLFVLGAAFALLAGSASALPTVYTSDAAWTGAAPGGLTTQTFEGVPGGSSTSLNFGTVTFNCNGSSWCPGFFGQSTVYSTDGTHSVFFATPDTATFTFSSAITAFGIDVIGLGDVGVTTFSINNGSGPQTLVSGYSAPGGAVTFAGIIDSAGFTQVTFSGTAPNDGVFFDRLRFGGAPGGGGAVPEPATWAIMILGFAGIGATLRRRRAAFAA